MRSIFINNTRGSTNLGITISIIINVYPIDIIYLLDKFHYTLLTYICRLEVKQRFELVVANLTVDEICLDELKTAFFREK